MRVRVTVLSCVFVCVSVCHSLISRYSFKNMQQLKLEGGKNGQAAAHTHRPRNEGGGGGGGGGLEPTYV